MKGITHFTAGMAAACLIPGAIEMAADGSMIILLGGVCGVMPDTIDFKWSRFVEDYQFEVDPDPHNPDPQAIADEVAAALDAAYEADGEPIGLMIHTTRVGADAWRQVIVTFDHENQEIRCKIGPIVTLGGLSMPGTDPKTSVATAKVKYPFAASYLDTIKVNVFSGPSWELRKEGDEVHLNFIAWHRRGTHSFFFAFCFFVLGWLLFGKWQYGMSAAGGVLMHMAEDQLGFMGCAALWPYTHKRWKGLGMWHSGDPLANFSSIWISLAVMAWMINIHHANPPLQMSLGYFALNWVLLPVASLWVLRAIFFPSPARARATLPREGEEGYAGDVVMSRTAQMLDALREQDVLNELGGAEGAP